MTKNLRTATTDAGEVGGDLAPCLGRDVVLVQLRKHLTSLDAIPDALVGSYTARYDVRVHDNRTLVIHPTMRENLRAFGEQIPAATFADFFGRQPYAIAAYSDYTGAEPSSDYEVYVTHVIQDDLSLPLAHRLASLRQRAQGRKVDFKGRKDRVKFPVVEEWIAACRETPGICIALCHDKKGKDLPGSIEATRATREALRPFGLSAPLAERMVRAVLYMAVIGHMFREADRFLWVSDTDEILAGKAREEMPDVIRAVGNTVIGRKLEAVGFCPPLSEYHRDLLTFPDLVGGALSTCLRRRFPTDQRLDDGVDEQAAKILTTLAEFPTHLEVGVNQTRLLVLCFDTDADLTEVKPRAIRFSRTPESTTV